MRARLDANQVQSMSRLRFMKALDGRLRPVGRTPPPRRPADGPSLATLESRDLRCARLALSSIRMSAADQPTAKLVELLM